MKMVDLDQGACGHQRRKPTTLLTNLPGMEDLAGMKGEGREELEKDLEGRLRQSREWAAWAPGMVAAIKASLQIYLRNISQMNHVKVKKAMSLEQWKQHVHRGHVPFDRRCRMCLQEAGVDRPHRRLKAAVSAYVLNVDITGPFVAGSDVGTGKKVKYALVATVAIPVKEVTPGPGEADGEEDEELRGERGHQGEPGDTADPGDHAAEDEALEGLECDDEEPRVSDAVAEAVNVKVRDEMKDALRGYQVQNVTAVELLESRKTKDVLLALGLLFSKYRSMGIPLYRMHCDRAKEFLAKPVRQWCAERNMILTLTGGDDHAANGRVEGEICQLKRRLRVTLKASGAPIRLWPTAIRHVALERMQDQLKSLGITPMPMLPYYAQVMVKTKRWHKSGGLAAPFKQVRLLGPSPTMMWGWVVQTAEGNVQHARAAILPEPLADRAMYELTIDPNPGKPWKRCRGKQSLEPGGAPRLGNADGGAAQGEPALRFLRAGGEYGDGDEKVHEELPGGWKPETSIWRSSWPLDWNVEEYREALGERYWKCRRHYGEELKRISLHEEGGAAQAIVMDYLSKELSQAEEELEFLRDQEVEGINRLCSMQAAGPGEMEKVLQTYTVPLSAVRQDLEKWKPAMEEEYQAITETSGVVEKVNEDDLANIPGIEDAEYAPAKLVTTIKAPHGRHRARVVICGNMLTAMNGDKEQTPVDKKDNYALGVDGTAIRCVLRKAAHEKWGIAAVDVKGAFLLAPRKETRRTLITRPPQILLQAGLCGPKERWWVKGAMYGLDSSPADWAAFRDASLKNFNWHDGGAHYSLTSTSESNLWSVVEKRNDKSGKVVGHVVVYVDDMMVCGPDSVVQGCLDRIAREWSCSQPEWVCLEKWIKFCGFDGVSGDYS